MNYAGYVTVDHDKLRRDVYKLLDLNDDGVFDDGDVRVASDKIMDVVSFGVPSGTGFGVGFLGGMRSG